MTDQMTNVLADDAIAALLTTIGTTSAPGPKATNLDAIDLWFKARVAEAVDAKREGRRDWERLGRAINDFDRCVNSDTPTWEIDAAVWQALDPFARYLLQTSQTPVSYTHLTLPTKA